MICAFFMTPYSLVNEMTGTTGEGLLERWQPAWNAIIKEKERDGAPEFGKPLQDLLKQQYRSGPKDTELNEEELFKFGEIIRRLLRLDPAARASAREILQDPWFHDAENSLPEDTLDEAGGEPNRKNQSDKVHDEAASLPDGVLDVSVTASSTLGASPRR
jgi:serine/threonine protein kinase